jgi:hypothetical protein
MAARAEGGEMKVFRLLLAVSVAALVLVFAAPPASAVDVFQRSQPNGDFTLVIFLRSDTDRDMDGNHDTATHGDKLFENVEVCRNFDRQQIVQFQGMVDRPGTSFDEQFSGTADLTKFSCVGVYFAESKVTKKWGTGPYTITIQAAGDTGDTGTASAQILIN